MTEDEWYDDDPPCLTCGGFQDWIDCSELDCGTACGICGGSGGWVACTYSECGKPGGDK